jgi:hypothetical protein
LSTGGGHTEINAYLGGYRPDLAKGVARGDEILAVVKCIFHKAKQNHSWYANALRQAFADKRTADDMTVYFRVEAPTSRAKKWRKDNPRASTPRQRLEVAIPGKLTLPQGLTIPPEGMTVLLIEKNGKPVLGIPQPRKKKSAESQQATA